MVLFLFKQKTAYEMRISDWSSDVCSSDLPILQWFDGRIAAELRLWDAVEQHRLVPFAYYGIADGTDYRNVSWRRGRGYAPGELSELVTGAHILARRIIDNTLRTVPNPDAIRSLAFLVCVAHTRFMTASFYANGLPVAAVPPD